jgi:hypothetical protein
MKSSLFHRLSPVLVTTSVHAFQDTLLYFCLTSMLHVNLGAILTFQRGHATIAWFKTAEGPPRGCLGGQKELSLGDTPGELSFPTLPHAPGLLRSAAVPGSDRWGRCPGCGPEPGVPQKPVSLYLVLSMNCLSSPSRDRTRRPAHPKMGRTKPP